MNRAMLDAALEYAAHGWLVFPIWPALGASCTCGSPDCGSPAKHPIAPCVPHGLEQATDETSLIEGWWARYPTANIATRTGLWCTVLDVDDAHGGTEALARLEAEFGPLPDTPRVKTGGGGLHYYFQHVDGLRNSAGKVGPGLDIRGEGGYVLVPPSTHVAGLVYRDDPMAPLFETPLAAMPAWLVARARVALPTNGLEPHAAPVSWAAKIAGAPEGQRHARAAELAGHWLHLMPVDEVEAMLLSWALTCTPPFPPAEARQIVKDLAAREQAKTEAAESTLPLEPLAIGLADFFARQKIAPKPVALIDGVLTADGSGWIAGEEKLGKTTYALEEALCLSLAAPVCGHFAVPERRRVLFFCEEDTPARAYRRACALVRGKGLDPEDPRLEFNQWFQIGVWTGLKLDDPRMLARLDAQHAAFRPTVAYYDSLRKIQRRDLNKAHEAEAFLETLDTLRRTYGTLARVIAHNRKLVAGGFRTGRGSQEIAGSHVLGAWGECSVFFEPVGRTAGAVRMVVQTKDWAPTDPLRLTIQSTGPALDPDTLTLSVSAEAAPHADLDERVVAAVQTLPHEPPVTGLSGVSKAAIATALKVSPRSLQRSLRPLEASGRLLVVGHLSNQRALYRVSDKHDKEIKVGHGPNV